MRERRSGGPGAGPGTVAALTTPVNWSAAWRRRSRSVRETQRLAAAIAGLLRPGMVLAMVGDMGAGKTHFVQGLAVALGVDTAREPVTSPTYSLLHSYTGGAGLQLVHLDLYRLEDAAGAQALGLAEALLQPASIAVVEWADRLPSLLPTGTIWLRLSVTGTRSRRLECLGLPPLPAQA